MKLRKLLRTYSQKKFAKETLITIVIELFIKTYPSFQPREISQNLRLRFTFPSNKMCLFLIPGLRMATFEKWPRSITSSTTFGWRMTWTRRVTISGITLKYYIKILLVALTRKLTKLSLMYSILPKPPVFISKVWNLGSGPRGRTMKMVLAGSWEAKRSLIVRMTSPEILIQAVPKIYPEWKPMKTTRMHFCIIIMELARE